jgi:quercetin dioxygenase-like cupin family protein
MAVVHDLRFQPLADEGDPDDWRPNSRLALVVDPRRADGRFVDRMAVFVEEVAPGDRIPLHEHVEDEVFFVDAGTGEITLGGDVQPVGPGSIVFIPARVVHGTRNLGDEPLRIHAAFPSATVTIRYHARNPAPGTEGDPPQAPVAIDVRALVEGRAEEAVRPIDDWPA